MSAGWGWVRSLRRLRLRPEPEQEFRSVGPDVPESSRCASESVRFTAGWRRESTLHASYSAACPVPKRARIQIEITGDPSDRLARLPDNPNRALSPEAPESASGCSWSGGVLGTAAFHIVRLVNLGALAHIQVAQRSRSTVPNCSTSACSALPSRASVSALSGMLWVRVAMRVLVALLPLSALLPCSTWPARSWCSTARADSA
jgi:hypothetical protein